MDAAGEHQSNLTLRSGSIPTRPSHYAHLPYDTGTSPSRWGSPDPGAYLTVQPTATWSSTPRRTRDRALWATGTNATANQADSLAVQDDGNVVLYAPGGAAVWSTGTNLDRGTALCAGDTLTNNQYLGARRRSSARQPLRTAGPSSSARRRPRSVVRHAVGLQPCADGSPNALWCRGLLRQRPGVWWSSNTDEGDNPRQARILQPYYGCYAEMQSDGNVSSTPELPRWPDRRVVVGRRNLAGPLDLRRHRPVRPGDGRSVRVWVDQSGKYAGDDYGGYFASWAVVRTRVRCSGSPRSSETRQNGPSGWQGASRVGGGHSGWVAMCLASQRHSSELDSLL